MTVVNSDAQKIYSGMLLALEDMDHWLFCDKVFSYSFQDFYRGKYVEEVVKRLSENDFTMDIAPRGHFKSTRCYLDVMYRILTERQDRELHYFSFTPTMAKHHVGLIRELIEKNVWFQTLTKDNKSHAETLINYTNSFGAKVTCRPQGINAFNRGIHCDGLYIDDPLTDPVNKTSPTAIYKVNRAIKEQILSMGKKEWQVRTVGTPQTHEDFFFDENIQEMFHTTISKAILSDKRKTTLWPEYHSYAEMSKMRRTLGLRVFDQEYQCIPAYETDTYLTVQELAVCVDDKLENLRYYDGDDLVIAGLDIGLKVHPSHFCIFRLDKESGKYIQLHSHWMDHWKYADQLAYIEKAIADFNITTCYYDGTGGEFGIFKQEDRLPPEMEEVIVGSFRAKNAFATNLGALIAGRKVKLLNDERQIRQMLQVQSNLEVFQSKDGHGDSFWSVAYALQDTSKPKVHVLSF